MISRLMNKFFFLVFSFCSLTFGFSASVSAATPYHVSDSVSIAIHSGPSNQFRIRGWVPSGMELTLLEKNSSTGYVKVKTSKGTEGWIEGRYLTKGNSVKARLPVIEEELNSAQSVLKQEQEKVATLTEQLTKLENVRKNELASVNDARAEGTAQIAQLENEIIRMQTKIDSMDETNMMGWLMRGGGIALLGVIIGLIIPSLPKKRRRSNDWF